MTSSPDVPETNWGKLWTESTRTKRAPDSFYTHLHCTTWTVDRTFQASFNTTEHETQRSGSRWKSTTAQHADNLGIILPSVFCHSTRGIPFLMHYSRNMSCTAAVRRWCTWSHNQILMCCFYIQYWCWSLSFLHWLSPQCTKKESIYQRNWSWTTGLINKVVMLEAFRWEIINITFIASRPVLFISWIITNRWGN